MKALRTGLQRVHTPTGGRTGARRTARSASAHPESTQASPPARPAYFLHLRRKDPRISVWASCSVCHEEKAGSTGSHEMTGQVCDAGIQAITDDSREGRQAVFTEITNAHLLQHRHSASIGTPPTNTK